MDLRFIIPLAFAAFAFFVCSEAPFVKMTNVDCESFNKSWVVFHYCRLKAYSRNKTSLNINLTVLEPVNDIFIKLKLMKKANGYKPFLYDITIDGCRFMRRPNNPAAKIVWNLIRRVSTVNHTCPYVGLQFLSDFHSIELPLPLPGGDYLLLMDYLFHGKKQLCTNVYFNMKEDW
ncbi:uncharacterized protein LOC108101784 [Drosophila ficusphila]|uniref:uncharacterized protein LOC108101784 n=1 Tax=Drosophila ficusphila TaxID=30025 RepID=UPI0007E8385D|nr:uncharacterized protein LOC108101784 [Drosophila ficusphila]